MSLLSLQRLVFYVLTPLTLFGSSLIRYNAFSSIYLVFLLVLPVILGGGRSWSRSRYLFQKSLLFFSVLVFFSHVVMQVVMVVDKPYGYFFNEGCSTLALVLRQIGFHQYKDAKVYDIVRLLLPDVAVLIVSILSVAVHRRKAIPRKPSKAGAISSPSASKYVFRFCSTLAKVFPLCVGGALIFAGIMQPNILSSVYFLTFLFVGTGWAFHVHNVTIFSWTKIALTAYSGCHVFILYLYQFPFFQQTLHPRELVPRLVGLTAVINNTNCDIGKDTEVTLVRTHTFPFYCYPFTVLLLYICLTLQRIITTYVNSDEERSFRELSSYPIPSTKPVGKEGTALLNDGTDPSQQYGAVEPVEGSTGAPEQSTTPQEDNIVDEEAQRDEIEHHEQHQPRNENITVRDQSTVHGIGLFLMRQSYIATLIIMMLWSILFHSWLTFVLLLWACLTWITPFARRFCMASSPYLVVYSNLLLLLQYMYGMALTQEELPLQKTAFSLSGVGMTRYPYPLYQGYIAAQIAFTLVFFVTLRQHFSEREDEQTENQSTKHCRADAAVLTTITGPWLEVFRTRVNSIHLTLAPSDHARDVFAYVKSALGKYWIMFCCLSFLLVALQNDVSLYQIIYMVIFLLVFIIYQFSLRTWKVVLKPLWWFMVFYSILILLMIYTYQFKDMPQRWLNVTGLQPDMLHDFGLRQQGKADLLMELFIPTVFSIVIVIQLHFFHKSLVMKVDRLLRYRKQGGRSTVTSHDNPLATPSSSEQSSQEEPELQSNGSAYNITCTHSTVDQLQDFYRAMTVTLWRLSELHISKFIYFATILVVVQRVSVINGVYVFMLALALPNLKLQKFVDYLLIVWSSISVIVFMLYQLRSVENKTDDVNCTAIRNTSLPFPTPARGSHFVNNAWWIGFYKVDHVRNDVFGYLCVMVFVVLKKVTRHHQEVYRFKRNIPNPPPHDDLFEDISRSLADDKLFNGIKFLCNNFFRLFGFKINMVMMVVTITVRGDSIAFLHSVWLILFLVLKWEHRVKIWPVYKVYMAILLPVQYLLVLGVPPSFCVRYPWGGWNRTFENIVQWLYLTDVQRPQDQHLLLLEYFQLAVACCYANYVDKQFPLKKAKKADPNSCLYHSEEEYTPPDYTGNKTIYDFIKILIFDHFFYLTLFVIYCTGQSTKSVFNSVYIIGCFFFLWHGKDLYLRPKAQIKRWWRCMILYNFFVIFSKVMLQLPSCVFMKSIYKESNCYLFQLLSLYCTRKNIYKSMNTEKCAVLGNGVGMDCVCFVFVLIQYIIFQSPYFIFIVNDHRQYLAMSSRAAQLVQERLQIRLQKSKRGDARSMARIKRKVTNARQKLNKFHATGNPYITQLSSHYEAIYTADAYLFQEESDPDSDADEVGDIEDIEDTTLSSASVATLEEDIFEDDINELPDDPVLETEPEEETSEAVTDTVSEETTDGTLVRRSVRTDTTDTISSSYDLYEKDLTKPPDAIEILSSFSEHDDYQMIEGDVSEAPWTDQVSKKVRTFKEVLEDWCHKLTDFFNNLSVDYRNVTVQLTREKREMLKSNADRYIPPLDAVDIGNHMDTDVDRILENKGVAGRKTGESVIEESSESSTWKKQHTVVSCAVAFYYVVLAHSDLLCYILMIANHIVNASLLSLPLPILVFLWGMLSVNRATKRFWITTMTYVEIMVVVKYVLQFQFPQDSNFNECSYYKDATNSPLCPPRIIGIEKVIGEEDNSFVWDVILLLGLLFHISSLKTQGLWRNKYVDHDEETNRESEFSRSGSKRRRENHNDLQVENEHPKDEDEDGGFCQNVASFFRHIRDPNIGTGSVDVYAWMFGIQLIVFIIILSCWSSFDRDQSSQVHNNMNIITNIIEGSAVPKTFLALSLLWFLITIFDRGVYMKKSVILKLAYLVVLVVLFHLFLFILVPMWTKIRFTSNPPAILMYLFLCIYFMLSAYQVRRGYPTHILCNFLTKKYTVFNAILFQGIQAIPFLLELRSVLDWVLTDTTLTLSHWLKMEDIYANVYLIKCWRDSEKIWPHPRGMAYWRSSKWWIGGLVVFSLVFVIWFPLLFMSMINMAYLPSHTVEVTFTLTVGGYQPLFKVTTQEQFLKSVGPTDIERIIQNYITHTKGETPDKAEKDCQSCQSLHSYTKGQGHLLRVKMLSNSSAIWTISPPARDLMINDLQSNNSISLRFEYSFRREQQSTQAVVQQETVSGVTKTMLKQGDPIRIQMAHVLTNISGEGQIRLPNLFPTFLQTPASGTVRDAKFVKLLNGRTPMVNCSIILRRGSVPHISNSEVEWWELKQDSPTPLSSTGPGYLEVIALNDDVPPLFLSFFVSKGVIGLYVGFVWLIGKFVRLYFTSISYRIMFDEMPNVNRVVNLCLEIYMARESAELELEEDLFAKLLFLYRSPETLIKFTKYKKFKTS